MSPAPKKPAKKAAKPSAAAERRKQREAAKAKEAEPFTEARITAENGREVTVRRHEDKVSVTWICGGVRTFTTEDLRAALDCFELVSVHGIWYEDDDSAHDPYAATLKDGEFHANDYVNGDNHHVPWGEFKAALEASVK